MSLGALTDLTGGIINNVTQPQSNIPLMFMLYRRSAARARASRHCSAGSLHCYASSVFGRLLVSILKDVLFCLRSGLGFNTQRFITVWNKPNKCIYFFVAAAI
jgi:hypothetical protein